MRTRAACHMERTPALGRNSATLVALLFMGCPAPGTQPPDAGPPAPLCHGAPRCVTDERAACPPMRSLSSASKEGALAELEWEEHRRHLRMRDALQPGFSLQLTRSTVDGAWDAGHPVCAETLRQVGRVLFEHDFSTSEGLGRGDMAYPKASPFRRVHDGKRGGPDTGACVSCHWRGGVAGGGTLVDESFIHGDGDTPDSADRRNPPSLAGTGWALRVAQELSEDLMAQRNDAVALARGRSEPVTVALQSHGIGFGVLGVSPDGAEDPRLLSGVDPDLQVRALGWKGAFADLLEFVPESAHVHFGMQSHALLRTAAGQVETLGPGPDADPDQDGHQDELSDGQVAALMWFVATLPPPVLTAPQRLPYEEPSAPGLEPPTRYEYADDWARGLERFTSVGCAECHTPVVVLRSPVLRMRAPGSDIPLELDLSAVAGQQVAYDPWVGGWPVWSFSDYRRHDLGAEHASQHPEAERGIPAQHYMTRRLWGLAHSSPYFYDGRSPSMEDAILRHGGEAADARAAYLALDPAAQADLRVFLMGLRRGREVVVP